MPMVKDTSLPRNCPERAQAIADERARLRKRTPLPDGYHHPIEELKPLPRPDREARRSIRKLFKMSSNDTVSFPRCPAKDSTKARTLDRALGYTEEQIKAAKEGYHTRRNHVCAECRCSRTAGGGTRGWWYWDKDSGLPEVGHYGVGPCFYHSPLYMDRGGSITDRVRDGYRGRILEEINIMQQYGTVQTQAGYLVNVRKAAEVARARTDTKTALHALKLLADETILKLRGHRDNPDALDEMTEKICALFGLPSDMLSPEEKQSLLQIVEQRPLTETAAGKHIPMSDKTSITMEMALIKAVGDAAFQSFKSHEEEFMRSDDVVRLIERFYAEAEVQFRTAAGEDRWTTFVANLKDIGHQISSGVIAEEPYPPEQMYSTHDDKNFHGPETLPPEKQPKEDT